MRALLFVWVLLAAWAHAPAAVAGPAPLTGSAARWLESVPNRMPAPAGAPITVSFAACPGLEAVSDGCWLPGALYLADRRRGTAMHELGHAFDDRDLTVASRAHLAALLGFSGKRWDDCGDPADLSVYGDCAAEVFADSYEACALGRPPLRKGRGGWFVEHETAYGWMPSPRRYRVVCRAIVRYGINGSEEG